DSDAFQNCTFGTQRAKPQTLSQCTIKKNFEQKRVLLYH
ncbi:unnamed protein product, partial [Brassica rapa subsp. narinosa]